MSEKQAPSEILTAPVAPLFVRMAMPIIFGLLVNGLYNFVDAIFISRAVGTDGIGGVTAAFPIHMITISISAMLGSGMASILSRRLGANLDHEASQIFSASVVLALITGFILSVIITIFSADIFALLELPLTLRQYAIDYLNPIAMFLWMSFCYGALNESFRAQGLNVEVFKMMALSAMVNIILDAIFLFGFGWGVAGAAWATVIAIFTAFLYAIGLYLRNDYRIKFELDHFRFRPKVHKEAVSLGIPVFLSYAGFGLMLLIINVAIVKVAPAQSDLLISAHGILNRTFMLIFLPIIGMMIAFQTFAGFNYGAQIVGRIGEGLKVALLISSGYALAWSIVMIFIPEYLLMLFTDDQQLITTAKDISGIVFILFITAGIATICPALFQALGFAKPAAWLNALHTYILLLPLLWLCVSLFGVDGIWWSFPIIDAITTAIIVGYTWYFMKQVLPTAQGNN